MGNTKLIEGINSSDYRAIDILSYSAIKDFSNGRLQFYKKHILKEKKKPKKSPEMAFGDLVDCLLFSENEYEDKFFLSTSKKPTGQMLKFVLDLVDKTLESTNEEGDLTTPLETLIALSYENAGFVRDKLDTVKEKFLIKKIGWDLYVDSTKNVGKTVIDTETLEWAFSLIEYMKNHPYTADVINIQNNDKYEVLDQIMLEGEIEEEPFKLMADRVIINKKTKIVTPLDLKVGTNCEMFPYMYLKMKYYLQNGVYTTLLRDYFPDCTVKPLAYVSIDKYRQVDPAIIKTSEKLYLEAMNGFCTPFGKKYTGVLDLVRQIKYHKETNVWTSSAIQKENNGWLDLENLSTEEVSED